MTPLVFLAHRIPYPPNKGDKIRSFNVLRHLARRWDVRLAAFVDDPDDWQHGDRLREWCSELLLVPLAPRRRRLASLTGLVTAEPLSVVYFRAGVLARWVRQQINSHGVRHAFVYSSTMAQYLRSPDCAAVRRVVDMVDVDSEKFREYGARMRGPSAWLHRREGRTLLDYERAVAAEFDATTFVSDAEAELFRERAPAVAQRVSSVTNGVDTEYFAPDPALSCPYPAGARVAVFTGAMDYLANIDAVTWFVTSVWPTVRAVMPEAAFYIVGARPAEAVLRLARVPGVTVTGAVSDVRPYLAHARTAVAPLRIARGLQNKVLEAMAMARPVVLTPAALQGIDIGPCYAPLCTDAPSEMAARLVALLRDGDGADFGASGRAFVLRQHAWAAHLSAFDRLLEAGPERRAGAPGRATGALP